jgi:uncharacterized membrane protein (UPF0127 family)
MRSSGEVVAENVRWARSLRERVRGLIGFSLSFEDALVFERAAQVHTFGMRGPIDVVFCNGDGRVLHVVRAMRPRRVSRWVRGARITVELAAGRAMNVSAGDVLALGLLNAGNVVDAGHERLRRKEQPETTGVAVALRDKANRVDARPGGRSHSS